MAKVKNDVWVRLDYDTWRKLPSTIKTMKSIMKDLIMTIKIEKLQKNEQRN